MKYLNLLVVIFLISGSALGKNSKSAPKKTSLLTLAILDSISETDRQAKYTSWQKEGEILKKIHFCQSIKEENLSAKEVADFDSFPNPAKDEPFLLYIGYNPILPTDETKKDPTLNALLDYAQKILKNGHSVIVSAGQSESGESKMIPRTFAGKLLEQNSSNDLAQVYVIGELSEQERLVANSHFGPEMFTAIKPPKELMGKNVAPYIFAHDLACATQLNPLSLGKLDNRKHQSHKIWVQADELFPMLP